MSSPRYEHKYLVPERLLDDLRRVIEPFVDVDGHAAQRPDRRYTVRNIYFDDARLSRYYEKDAGVAVRAKPRLRGYGDYRPGDRVFLEVKRRHGSTGTKDRALMPFADLAELIETGDVARLVDAPEWLPGSRVSARNFLFHLHHGCLRPVLLEIYAREPYVGRYEPSLRVTIDTHVRSSVYPELGDLFAADGVRDSFRGYVVLEVKHDAVFGFPRWLRPFIGRHSVIREALSKYWTCLTDWRLAARTDLRVRTHATTPWPPGLRARAEEIAANA